MTKYRKITPTIEAVPFKKGMEDGYASYDVFGKKFYGFFKKGGAVPKNDLRPAIKNIYGWFEVKQGDYIITEESGMRYPESKEFIDEHYEIVEEEINND